MICTLLDFANAAYIGLSSSDTHKLPSILSNAEFQNLLIFLGFIRDSLHLLPVEQSSLGGSYLPEICLHCGLLFT